MAAEHKNDKDVAPRPVQARRGIRPGAGADTPSGPDTDRTVKPEKRQQAELEEERTNSTPAHAAARAARERRGTQGANKK